MTLSRRALGVLLIGTGACLAIGPAVVRLFAQEAAPPNRREFAVTAKDYHFSPNRLEVTQDDLVKVVVRSEDFAYSLTIDEYRLSRRVPAGGEAVIEFRADRPGSYRFYSNLTSDARHTQMRGDLVVKPH